MGEIGDIIEPKAKNREEFIDELKRGVFDNVLVVYRTFQSVSTTGLFNSELVSLLPKGLRFICHYGAALTVPIVSLGLPPNLAPSKSSSSYL